MSAHVFMKFLSESVILLSIWGRISNRLNVSAVCCIPFAQNVMLTITPLLKVLQRSLKVLILLRWQLWLHAEKRSELQVRIDILFSQWLKCLWFNRTVLFQKEKIDWKDVSLRALGIIIYDNHSNEKIVSKIQKIVERNYDLLIVLNKYNFIVFLRFWLFELSGSE